MALLDAIDVRKTYGTRANAFDALAGVSMSVDAGRTLAIVGESGSGKSTFGNIVAGLQAPSAGELRFDGELLPPQARGTQLRRAIQMVFQSPFQSLNPKLRIETVLFEPLNLLAQLPRAEASARIDELLDMVRLPRTVRRRLPSELSGGQQQRVAIARALAPSPRLIVLDEPTSGLDQSVRGQIVTLLRDLQSAENIAYLFITHDIDVAKAISHDAVVMQRGRIVESGPAADVLARPTHAYTRALLDAVPVMDPTLRARRVGVPAAMQRTTAITKEN